MYQRRGQNRRNFWLKSTARGSPGKKRTDEPQRPGKRCGQSTQPRRNNRRLRKRKQPTATQTREEAEHAEGDDKDEDEDYVPSEEPSSEDPTYEPTKKELRRADKEGDQ